MVVAVVVKWCGGSRGGIRGSGEHLIMEIGELAAEVGAIQHLLELALHVVQPLFKIITANEGLGHFEAEPTCPGWVELG